MPFAELGSVRPMQLQEMHPARLRALTEVEVPAGRVVSLLLNLDPVNFAAPPARTTAIRSALDELDRRIDDVAGELGHDELAALRRDRAGIARLLAENLGAEGAHGLAVFACSPAGLWEVARLAHPVDSEVVVDTVPHVEQLARGADTGTWAVVLVSRSRGRVLRGDAHRLVVTIDHDDAVHGQHDQGGWSQPRYQRSVDREADAHVHALLDALERDYRRRPFQHLLFIAPGELWPSIQRALRPDIAPLVAGRVDAGIGHSTPDELLEVARPEMERVEIDREHELLARLAEGLGTGGRSVAGLQPTLDMLLQKRVDTLLLLDRFRAAGAACPACGWMSADPDVGTCPVDGRPVERHASIADVAVASALQQGAAVVVVPRRDDPADPDTGPSARFLALQGHGGAAAILRF